MDAERLIIIGSVSFLTSIVSGIGGGGGGFIGTPLLIFLGLTPQQAVATGKIGGLGVTLGSLQGLAKAKVHKWDMVIKLMLLATIIGLLAPHVITHIDNGLYRKILGALLIVLIPIILFKEIGIKTGKASPWKRFLGWPVLVVTLLLQAVFSGGMGTLVVLALMGLMGMKVLEANVTKRFSQAILNVLIVLGLLGSGLIIWSVAATLFASNTAGGYIGSQIAIKRGDRFITYVFVILMLISGLGLMLG